MRMISPAVPIDENAREYRANGDVIRVFDQNCYGQLLPVAFEQLNEHSKFRLERFPFGRVYVETDLSNRKARQQALFKRWRAAFLWVSGNGRRRS